MTDAELLARARAMRQKAYAPYSRFLVGAAVLAGGQVYDGANVENASYGLCVCAERNAVFAAVLAGQREISVCAVATGTSPPGAPCGMCLQTLREFTTNPAALRVLLTNDDGAVVPYTLAQLLPHGFGPADLKVP
jgi:cytidine deaminase